MNAQFEIDRLRKQLTEARKSEPEQIAALRQRVSALEQERARRESAAKAKAAKPPLDPESAAAREIKGLKTRAKNLQSELARARAKHGHIATFVILKVVGAITALRVTPEAEQIGLDISQHGEWRIRGSTAWQTSCRPSRASYDLRGILADLKGPERSPLPTDADREQALKAFNAWKSDNRAAEQRKAR